MKNKTASKPRLGDLIEKIITRGNLTREDQRAINSYAGTGYLYPGDNAAVEKLIRLIGAGTIKVLA